MPAQTLADILLKHQAIDSAVYQQIKSEQLSSGSSQEQIIESRRFASVKAIVMAKAELNHLPFIDVQQIGANPQALTYLPQAVAQRFLAFPYDYKADRNLLKLVMANPLDIAAIDFIKQKSGKEIEAAYGNPNDLQEIIAEKYAQNLSSSVDQALKENDKVDEKGDNIVVDGKLNDVIKEAPIAKIVGTLLSFAMKSLASDVHIEPMENKTRVRYRIDGILHEKLILPKNVHDAVVSRIKILARLKIDEKRVPQDGRFTFRSNDDEVDLRVSTLPTVNGEKIVMRLLKKGGNIPTFQELGIRGRAVKNLEENIAKSNGVVLVTGPTGSGKTTTLYSALHKINNPKVNIITLEDPVEYEMVGISQVQVNPVAGLTFASGLRSFLRQDPDVIMVGEIRDRETADLAIEASLTGHLVFSTLHTNSSAGALPRLIDMGIEPFLLASSINAIVGQRVVRKICEHCKVNFEADQELIAKFKEALGPIFDKYLQKGLHLMKGRGCTQCDNSGYKGRIGIYEVMPITEKIGKLVIAHAPEGDIQKEALNNGMLTMEMDGYIKVLDGITTVEEVMRVANN